MAAPAPVALPVRVRELGGIEEYRLANGLRFPVDEAFKR